MSVMDDAALRLVLAQLLSSARDALIALGEDDRYAVGTLQHVDRALARLGGSVAAPAGDIDTVLRLALEQPRCPLEVQAALQTWRCRGKAPLPELGALPPRYSRQGTGGGFFGR